MNAKSEVIHGHVVSQVMADDGLFPNNPALPVLVYKGAVFLHPADEAEHIQDIFSRNGWDAAWKGDIYSYQHYHSTAHEVLAVFCGTADLQLGGPEGICVELSRGDVVIIPAGVAHKKLKASEDFLCVGAYPHGQEYDMNYGKEEERPVALSQIAKVRLPDLDPVFGADGPLMVNWQQNA